MTFDLRPFHFSFLISHSSFNQSYHELPSFLRPYQTGLCLSTTVVAMIDETLGFGQPLVSILRCQHPLAVSPSDDTNVAEERV